MNYQRKGKIARLPCVIRDELNGRIVNGQTGAVILEWLNSLPVVREVLAADFGGEPVHKRNLSRWRMGGYREWLLQQEAASALRRIDCETLELRKTGGEPGAEASGQNPGVLTDNMALWLAARYLVAVQGMETEDGTLDWRHLREFCADLARLRRGDHAAARLDLDSKRELSREAFPGKQSKLNALKDAMKSLCEQTRRGKEGPP